MRAAGTAHVRIWSAIDRKIRLGSRMVASPLGLQSCPGTRCRPGRAAGCGTREVAEGLPCFYLEVSPSWYGGYLGAYTTHSHYTIG